MPYVIIEDIQENIVECPVNSMGLFCKMHCPNGFKKDERGCDLPCKFYLIIIIQIILIKFCFPIL